MTYQFKTPIIATIATIAMVTLSACATMSPVKAGESFKADTAFSVTPSSSWSKMPATINPMKGSVLTQDGVPLGAVYLVTVKNDKPMLDNTAGKNLPRYTAGSTALGQVDLVEASMSLIGYLDVATTNVRPATVSGQSGTQFGLTGKYPNGLQMKGDVLMFESNEGLNITLYAAPEMHYYNKYKNDVDVLFNSVRLN